MHCKNWGHEITDDNISFCPKCGNRIIIEKIYDPGSIGWMILALFFPIIGLILYYEWHEEKPNNAKMALYGAIPGLFLKIIGFIFL